jgi:hypothetical protein
MTVMAAIIKEKVEIIGEEIRKLGDKLFLTYSPCVNIAFSASLLHFGITEKGEFDDDSRYNPSLSDYRTLLLSVLKHPSSLAIAALPKSDDYRAALHKEAVSFLTAAMSKMFELICFERDKKGTLEEVGRRIDGWMILVCRAYGRYHASTEEEYCPDRYISIEEDFRAKHGINFPGLDEWIPSIVEYGNGMD